MMATFLFETDDGALGAASAVVEIRATNPDYNQPALRVTQEGIRGGAASIRIDDPNPDIELIETDVADTKHPAKGKYEIAVQSDELQFNGRKEDNSGFETMLTIQRPGAGGNIGFRTGSQFGAGKGVVAIANALTVPSVNPSGGGVLFVDNGALKYLGSAGTVTTIAPA